MSAPPPKRPHPLERAAQAPPPPSERPQRRGIAIPTARPTLAPILLVILVLVFIAQQLDDPYLTIRFMKWNPAIFKRDEYYRLFTVMFLHLDVMHIFFNAYALYVIGFTVERYFGAARFALIYFLGGLGASIASLALTPAPAVGASGAIFAIFGAEGVFFYRHRKLFGAAGRRHLNNLIIFAVLNLALGFAGSATSGGARIDNWAHVGGLVGGIALTWFIGPRIQLQFDGGFTEPVAFGSVKVVDTNPLKRAWPAALAFAILLAVVLAVVVAANS